MAKKKQDQEPARKNGRRPKDVRIYRSWCKQCGICAAFCPKGVLEMGSDGPVWARPDECVGCGICELRCPDFAIEVISEKEVGEDAEE